LLSKKDGAGVFLVEKSLFARENFIIEEDFTEFWHNRWL